MEPPVVGAMNAKSQHGVVVTGSVNNETVDIHPVQPPSMVADELDVDWQTRKELDPGVMVRHGLPIDRLGTGGFNVSVERGKMLVACPNCQHWQVRCLVERLQVDGCATVADYYVRVVIQIDSKQLGSGDKVYRPELMRQDAGREPVIVNDEYHAGLSRPPELFALRCNGSSTGCSRIWVKETSWPGSLHICT